jgi:hypothetical protein
MRPVHRAGKRVAREHNDFVARSREMTCEVRTEEARTAGDHHAAHANQALG